MGSLSKATRDNRLISVTVRQFEWKRGSCCMVPPLGQELYQGFQAGGIRRAGNGQRKSPADGRGFESVNR
jgi:hypothetical protein